MWNCFPKSRTAWKKSFNVMLLNYPIRACQCLTDLYVLSLVTAHYYKETECPWFHSGGISHFKKFLSYTYYLVAHLHLRYLCLFDFYWTYLSCDHLQNQNWSSSQQTCWMTTWPGKRELMERRLKSFLFVYSCFTKQT